MTRQTKAYLRQDKMQETIFKATILSLTALVLTVDIILLIKAI